TSHERGHPDLALSFFSSSASPSAIPDLKLRILSPMPLASWGKRFAPKSMRTITRIMTNSMPPGAQNKNRLFMEISLISKVGVAFEWHCIFALAIVSVWRLLDVLGVPMLYCAPVSVASIHR